MMIAGSIVEDTVFQPVQDLISLAREKGVEVDGQLVDLGWALRRGLALAREDLVDRIARTGQAVSVNVYRSPPSVGEKRGMHRTTRRTPRGPAIDETVALAIKLGQLKNADLIANGLVATSSGADQRIQATLQLGRIERVERGVYVAIRSEYLMLGLDVALQGRSCHRKVVELVAQMRALREPPPAPEPEEPEIDFDATPRDDSIPADIDDLSKDEIKVVLALRALPEGESKTLSALAWELFEGRAGTDATSWVRNALRRPCKYDLVRKVDRGRYIAVRPAM